MIQVRKNALVSYHHPEDDGDPLSVEKGYCHYSHEGTKDFLNIIEAYEPTDGGVAFQVTSFRGFSVLVNITFITNTVFRFQMFPNGKKEKWLNSVFDLSSHMSPHISDEDLFIVVKTDRLTLYFRKCPWEMRIELDGSILTMEQIKDHNVDQKYKAVPVGFSKAKDGHILNCFETMYMYSDECFYGFGEKFTSFNKRGQKITVWQRDAQSTNSDISYKGMPYFMSSYGYSILLNTYTRTHFNMGATSGVSYTMETEDPYLDYFMFCNRNYKGLLRDYTALTGRSPMIPRWAFGFWMSRMSYMTRQEVEQIVDQMEKFGMSVDVIHIDAWGSQGDEKELLCFDEKRFPDPEGMIQNLKQKGIHLSLWMFPYVPAVNRQGEFSLLFRSMKERNFLVKNKEGDPYVFSPGEGDAGNWKVAALDFTNPSLVSYMKERVKRLIRMGAGVIKTDFSEEIPEDAVFYDGTNGIQTHNKYTLLYAKTIYEACSEAKKEMGDKAIIWGRSGYAGSQNYPANWAGDSSASKNNLYAILNGGLSIGISGVSFWGFDIGGFYNCDYSGQRTIPDDDDYIRSVQMGLMSPLSRSHGQATPREPWVFSEQAQKAFLKINKQRYRMLPYLYSTAYETVYEGVPMMRAMLLEFEDDINVRNISTQYMLGSSILVAPVFDQQRQYIYLPNGSWIDLEKRERIQGGRWIEYPKKIDVIPMFLRQDTCLELLEKAPNHIREENFDHLIIVVNLVESISTYYYDDNLKGVLSINRENSVISIQNDSIPIDEFIIYCDMPVSLVRYNDHNADFTIEKNVIVVKRDMK